MRRALGWLGRPWWILKVRAARVREDRGGVDIVVQLDVGRVFLQVKRSRNNLAAWIRKHAGDPRPIGIVVCGEWESVDVAYGRALGQLILLRERLEREAEAEAAEMDAERESA